MSMGAVALAAGCTQPDRDSMVMTSWPGPVSGSSTQTEGGDDDEDTGSPAGDSAATDDGDAAPGGSESGPSETAGGPSGTTSSGETSGDPVYDGCLELAADACEICGCDMCLEPLYACEMDPGCVAMRECAQASGCSDVTSCYEACEDVINQHGGVLGDSAALALELSECLDASCPVCF